MKKLSVIFTIVLLVVMATTSCNKNPIEPVIDPPDTMGKLILVPLGNEALARKFTGTDGKEYLPREAAMENLKKMGRLAIRLEDLTEGSLAKIAAAMINYGEVLNTRTLQYVIMNVGNQDIFDIDFTANNLEIFPGAISLIQASEQGTEVTALPIVNIVKEHVTPLAGIGSLLEMEVGEFTDTLTLSYSYTLGSDTVTVTDEYDVAGTKMGAIINLEISGQSLIEYPLNINTFNMPGYNFDFQSYYGLSSADLDTVLISNSGNAPLRVRIVFSNESSVALDSLIQGSESLNLSGILRGDNYATSGESGELIILGSERNQPYAFTFEDELVTTGVSGVWIGED